MKTKLTILLAAAMFIVCNVACQNSCRDGSADTCVSGNTPAGTLRFHDGIFRIAQFTDIHWVHGEAENTRTIDVISKAIAANSADLAILTGDIVTGGDPELGWRDIIGMMEAANVPYLVLMGNHDPEHRDKDSIYGLLRNEGPHHIGNQLITDINGAKSCLVEILAEASDTTAAAIFGFDSGNHYADPLRSDYDNIHLDQIRWYVEQSNRLKTAASDSALPALAFFHICLPEFADLAARPTKIAGNFGEPCCPSDINSGLLSAALEQGDIMGFFVGHDHANDCIGLWKGLALGYGRQSGVLRDEQPTPRGCRIIEMKEHARQFETWIWTSDGEETRFHYPTGITSEMENGPHLAARKVNDNALTHGIRYTYFEGKGGEKSTAAMLVKGNAKSSGITDRIDISHAPADDHFGYTFDGYFLAETRGVYIFSMMSDDGSRLYIDDRLIIDLDGSHSATPEQAYIALEQGFHKIKIDYFEDYMGEELSVWLATRTLERQPLPARLLFAETDR